jgi:hypothetical protein
VEETTLTSQVLARDLSIVPLLLKLDRLVAHFLMKVAHSSFSLSNTSIDFTGLPYFTRNDGANEPLRPNQHDIQFPCHSAPPFLVAAHRRDLPKCQIIFLARDSMGRWERGHWTKVSTIPRYEF